MVNPTQRRRTRCAHLCAALALDGWKSNGLANLSKTTLYHDITRLVDRCRVVFGCLDMEYDVDDIMLDYVIYRLACFLPLFLFAALRCYSLCRLASCLSPPPHEANPTPTTCHSRLQKKGRTPARRKHPKWQGDFGFKRKLWYIT